MTISRKSVWLLLKMTIERSIKYRMFMCRPVLDLVLISVLLVGGCKRRVR